MENAISKFICPVWVKSLFSYNEETGELKKIKGRIRSGKTGFVHTGFGGKKYIRVGCGNDYFYAHRIIWVFMTGCQPLEVDHIDGNGLNNKWNNLREVSHRVNGKNQKLHVTNTSGKGGITYRKDSNKWRARITVDGKAISLGNFENKRDAISARLEAEHKYNFLIG